MNARVVTGSEAAEMYRLGLPGICWVCGGRVAPAQVTGPLPNGRFVVLCRQHQQEVRVPQLWFTRSRRSRFAP